MTAQQLSRSDLWSLEEYAERRPAFKASVLAHKENRRLMLGNHLQLIFEDRLSIQYQIQEMLRIEKVFEAAGIQEELDAYNPLIPDGDNWKCTLLIQYEDVDERKKQLAALLNVEHAIWIKVGDHEPVFAIADEDMERANDEKTSAVHFLRFQLDEAMVKDAKAAAQLTVGVDHTAYPVEGHPVPAEIASAIIQDLI